MSVYFDGASHLLHSAAVRNAVPVGMAIGFRTHGPISGNPVLMCLSDTAGAINTNFVKVQSDYTFRAGTRMGSTVGDSNNAITTVLMHPGAWHVGIGNVVSDVLIEAWLDGDGYGNDTTDVGTFSANLDITAIGALVRSTVGSFFTGWVSWAAIYSAQLTSDDARLLGAGAAPWQVVPGSLAELWVFSGVNPLVGVVGGRELTPVGGITFTDDEPPAWWMPGPRRVFRPAFNPAWARHANQVVLP